MHFDFVASTIIGATKAKQLDDTLRALETTLSDELLEKLDSVHDSILYPMG